MKSLALPTALPEEIGLSSARLNRLTQVMRDEVARGRVPGAVALIARRGKIGYLESCGQRDPVKGTPMTKDTIFRIYSITKPIVPVAAMMCAAARLRLWTRFRRSAARRHRTGAGVGRPIFLGRTCRHDLWVDPAGRAAVRDSADPSTSPA
jgi:hypothetical protein